MSRQQAIDRIFEEISGASSEVAYSYLCGASRDATLSRRHGTIRFAQADRDWLVIVQGLLQRTGFNSWIYREGRTRNVFVLESRCAVGQWPWIGSTEERAAFVRGYFDAEGGIPQQPGSRLYLQFAQKSETDLRRLRNELCELGISCGKVHNPSVRMDPNYWRFFVLSRSHQDFIQTIGSWHPRKHLLLAARALGKNGDA
jgi:hypothetical protein